MSHYALLAKALQCSGVLQSAWRMRSRLRQNKSELSRSQFDERRAKPKPLSGALVILEARVDREPVLTAKIVERI